MRTQTCKHNENPASKGTIDLHSCRCVLGHEGDGFKCTSCNSLVICATVYFNSRTNMKIQPNSPNHIGIEFKVWAPKLTRVTKKLFLLGSLKELGAWNIDKALKASTTTDMHIWTVEASIPAMSSFEWVWLTTNLSRLDVEWEKSTKRNRKVDCFSGTLHTIWGDSDEVFLQSATCVEMTTYVRVEESYTLVLTGSTPSTGEWNLHNAKPATEFPKRSGYWKIDLAFDALTNLEFKWAVVMENDKGIVRSQEKLAHSIFGRKSWMRAVAPWMTPIIVIVDTSLICDFTDTLLGRTDVIVKERKKRAEEIKSWLLKAEEDKAMPIQSHKRLIPGPTEKPVSLASYSSLTQPVRPGIDVAPSPTFSSTSMTGTQRAGSLDEHIKQKEEETSKSEKLTQQLFKKFSEDAAIYAIKGRGQTQLQTDKMNIGYFQVEATHGLSRAYGEVAEITSMHLPTSSSLTKKKINSSSLGNRESQDSEGLAEQLQESGFLKARMSEETPMVQEGEHLQIKGAVCSDYESGIEDCLGCGFGNEILPLCAVSQTVPDAVRSDTGFTEMSSWMSGARTDATGSESALTSSHTMTCVLAGDTINMSGVEESRSNHAEFQSHRMDCQNESMVSYWESRQCNLSLPWMDKDYVHLQGGSGDILAEHLAANEEENEHFEWLASRLEEDTYPTINYKPDIDSNHESTSNDFEIHICEREVGHALDSLINHERWISTSPPKPSPADDSSLTVSPVSENEQISLDDNSELYATYSYDFDHLYENDLAPYAGIESYSEDEELAQKAKIARDLEQLWGASYKTTDSVSVGNIPVPRTTTWKKLDDQYSVVTALADEIRGLMSSEGKAYRMAYYSCCELSDMLLPEPDFIDHREKAREMEKMWGEHQATTS